MCEEGEKDWRKWRETGEKTNTITYTKKFFFFFEFHTHKKHGLKSYCKS